MQKLTPCIWFKENAEDAMNFYVSTFKNSKIKHIERYTGDQGIPGEKELKGKVLTGIFEIDGQELICLDGGLLFELTAAISFQVEFEIQEELDEVWDKILDGGKAQQCGWITDKFGVTWQIVPKAFGELMSSPDTTPAQKKALMAAMMPMVKLDMPKLQEAYDNAK